MTVKIKTFGSMDDAIEWFREGRPKRIAAVVVVQSAEAELSRPEVAMIVKSNKAHKRGVSLADDWRNAVCAYAQLGMRPFSGKSVRLPPTETTLKLLSVLSPMRVGRRNRISSAMAGALARIVTVHPQHGDAVEQFAYAVRDAATAADRNDMKSWTAHKWNAKAVIEFAWSLYADRSLCKTSRGLIVYRATAAAFFNALQGARVIKFSTSVPTADCIVK